MLRVNGNLVSGGNSSTADLTWPANALNAGPAFAPSVVQPLISTTFGSEKVLHALSL